MTIVYIHGVKVRSPDHGIALRGPFLRWLGPKLSGDGTGYEPAYWGDLVSNQFRWGLSVRPPTSLLGLGADDVVSLGAARVAPEALRAQPLAGPVADSSVLGAAPVAVHSSVLQQIPLDRRPDFLSDLYLAARASEPAGGKGAKGPADPVVDDPGTAALASVASAVAARWTELTANLPDDDARARALMGEIDRQLDTSGLHGMGGFPDFVTRAGEVLRRAVSGPGKLVSTVLAEARPLVNDFVATFLGDVLTYQATRDAAGGGPGPIPGRVLDALAKAHRRKRETGERIIVVCHSMGGQLFYDAVTFYAAEVPDLAGLQVDHWITCGAQVSFFAELGLFKGQPDTRGPAKLDRPRAVLKWTNYYDPNDPIGFVMAPVFDGVRDLEYDTGYGLALAHTGFLARPSFFERVASEIGPNT